MWVLNGDGEVESWSKIFRFAFLKPGLVRLVGMTNNEQLLLNFDGELIRYDLNKKQYCCVGLPGDVGSFNIDAFSETLYLIDD